MSKGPKLPVKPLLTPFTDEHRLLLEEVEARLPQIEDLLLRMHEMGLDVQAHGSRHEAHKAAAAILRKRFFPVQMPNDDE